MLLFKICCICLWDQVNQRSWWYPVILAETLISGPSQALPISAICPKSIRRQLPNICLLTRAAGDSWSLNRDNKENALQDQNVYRAKQYLIQFLCACLNKQMKQPKSNLIHATILPELSCPSIDSQAPRSHALHRHPV